VVKFVCEATIKCLFYIVHIAGQWYMDAELGEEGGGVLVYGKNFRSAWSTMASINWMYASCNEKIM